MLIVLHVNFPHASCPPCQLSACQYSPNANCPSTVAEHNIRDFDLIFQLKTAQNMVAEHFERDFDMIFH